MAQIFSGFNKLHIAGKLLACGVIVALPLTFNIGVLAQPAGESTPSVSQPADASTDPIGQKLFGQWEMQDNSFPTKLNLLFTPEGNFFLILSQRGKSGAYPLKYRINPTPQPMHLDVILPDAKEPVETIFEFTADGQLRLQLNGTDPGKPRPKDFGTDVSLFKKISDSTTLPENVEVISTEPAKPTESNSPQAEAKSNIGTVNRAQQAFFLEYAKFAKTLNELQVGIKSETENYSYRIIPQRTKSPSVAVTATAKKPGLKSFTGFVYTTKAAGTDELLSLAIACETNQASRKAPAVPQIPRSSSQQAKCPAGSTSLTR
jgi:hypothetical protein